MKKFVIQGQHKLSGTITLGGAKNAGFKLMIGALLSDDESRLLNVTPIGDVQLVVDTITSLGGQVTRFGETTYYINPRQLSSYRISSIYGGTSRASLMFAGPLLARFGQAELPFPGGDKIGNRDLDRHFDGLKALGARVEVQGETIVLTAKKLKGATYRFAKPSHTGTETLLLAAVLAEGETILENAALEPEVDDLINFLNKMGAQIQREANKVIKIQGVSSLHSAIHRVMPDRNQTITYALAAILTGGDIIIEDAEAHYLESFLNALSKANGGYEVGNFGIRFFHKGLLKPTNITTEPHPGFMTDWQPLWATFMTQAVGESTIIERLYDNRFTYVEVLNQAGAEIEFFDPNPEKPEEFYLFNLKAGLTYHKQGIKIHGKTPLQAFSVPVWDVRYGATLLLAALIAEGESELHDIHHIERGYYQIEQKLRQLGAAISRQT